MLVFILSPTEAGMPSGGMIRIAQLFEIFDIPEENLGKIEI